MTTYLTVRIYVHPKDFFKHSDWSIAHQDCPADTSKNDLYQIVASMMHEHGKHHKEGFFVIFNGRKLAYRGIVKNAPLVEFYDE
jgi:hypothetical protein